MKKLSALLLGSALLAAAATYHAEARTVPGSMGHAAPFSNQNCWSHSNGRLSNTCTTQQLMQIPLPVDTSGSKTVVVNAAGASTASNVGCQAIGSVATGTTIYTSGAYRYLPAFGGGQDIVLSSVYVPTNGYLFVNCTALPGGRINSVRY